MISFPPSAPDLRTSLPPSLPGARRLIDLSVLDRAPLDLRILGRTLLHAALVGALAGLAGVVFFFALEAAQDLLLHRLGGYTPLRAAGEHVAVLPHVPAFRPWLVWLLPGLGALLGGVLSARFAPETAGGGAEANIAAFHQHGGRVRRRVALVKAAASVLTLGTGGSGGREGPTMQIGGALGSLVGQLLHAGARERRILLVAGVAAGMAAVFRTPLGAALLAVEVLYRDDFESDALIPALLASVIGYSVFVSFYGESTLFGTLPRMHFVPAHLPLYGLLALVIALMGTLFIHTLHAVRRNISRLPVPPWARPGVGGLMLGVLTVPLLWYLGQRMGQPGQGFGILGGGYGAAQAALTGAPWLGAGWTSAALLFGLAFTKMAATSLTVGSGGSAGDFGPSLVLGGLIGGAFGQAALLLTGDPRIQPAAFALVGMGTFYGGIAHVPVSSLVMVCELAGSYDLLVPLMLAEGLAFVALRRRSLYLTQPASRRDSPAHRHEYVLDALRRRRVGDILVRDRPYVAFAASTPAAEVLRLIGESTWQDIFPVLSAAGQVVGMIDAHSVRVLAPERELDRLAVAHDLMSPPVFLSVEQDLYTATRLMLQGGAREMPVTDESGHIVGFLDETEVVRAYFSAAAPDDSER